LKKKNKKNHSSAGRGISAAGKKKKKKTEREIITFNQASNSRVGFFQEGVQHQGVKKGNPGEGQQR